MGRTRQTREDKAAEKKVAPGNDIDRLRKEAIKRGKQRLSRGGSMESFNKRLEVDLPLLQEIYPGWCFRWVKDGDGRIARMRERGYELVPYDARIGIGADSVDGNTDVGGHVSVIAGADKEGGYRQYLMMIPEEIMAEIKKMKQEVNDGIDRSINQHLQGEGENAEVANKYVPESGGGSYKP
jgi:hypothetical protein